MRANLLVLILVATAGTAPERAPRERIASEFLAAYRAESAPRMAAAGLKPVGEVAYALVVERLLESGEIAAAAKLASLRAGAADGKGLARLVQSAREGARPTKVHTAALAAANLELKRNRAAAARAILIAVPDWPSDTLTAVRAAALYAQVDQAEERFDLAMLGWADAARQAQRTGWLSFAYDLRRREFQAALRTRDGKSANEALGEQIVIARALGRTRVAVDLLMKRAEKLLQRKLYEDSRADLFAAIDLAKSDPSLALWEAQLTGMLGAVYLADNKPQTALLSIREAIGKLQDVDSPRASADLLRTRYNEVLALTSLRRYDAALGAIDHLLQEPAAAAMRPDLLARRAYNLGRRGSLVKALRAYEQAMKEAASKAKRRDLLLELAEIQLRRRDPASARRLVYSLEDPTRTVAGLVVLAMASAREGDADQARKMFEMAHERARQRKRPREEGRLLLRWAAMERAAGDLSVAIERAKEARTILTGAMDYGNIAAADVLLGNLLVEQRRFEEAQAQFERATMRIRLVGLDMGTEAGLYALRYGLALRELRRFKEASPQIDFALKAARAVRPPDRGLESAALSARALLDASRADGKGDPVAKSRNAIAIAEKLGDHRRLATIYTNHAMIAPEKALESVDRALEHLDALRGDAKDSDSLMEGESPWFAPSLGIRVLLADEKMPERERARRALGYASRLRAAEVQSALRGRDAILQQLLGDRELAAWVKVRARLVEARAEKRDVEPAEKALDDFAARLRRHRPWLVSLAFPRAVRLADVQADLKEGEALVRIVHDVYAHAVIVVTRDGAWLRPMDVKRPLDAVAPLLDKTRRLIVVPDGLGAQVPIETAPFDKATVFDRFEVFYLPAARSLAWRRAVEGAPTWSDEPLRLDFKRPAATAQAWIAKQGFGGAWVSTRSNVERSVPVRAGGLLALVEGTCRGSGRPFLLPLFAETDPALWAELKKLAGRDSPAAHLHAAKRAARVRLKDPKQWAGAICYGLPD